MDNRVIYPGTFDPLTYGHIDIIKRTLNIFDEVIVAVAHNLHKRPLFDVKERVSMLRKATSDLKGVSVEAFSGLVIEYAREKRVKAVVRGLRMISDFEYEFQMALTNRKLAPDIETIFMMPSEEYSYISSKLMKEAASLGADLSAFLPPSVEKRFKERLRKV